MIAEAVAQYLSAQVGGLTYDPTGTTGNIFVGDMPSDPALAVMVKGTGGEENDTRLGYDTPTVQVLTRGGDPFDRTSGYAEAAAISAALHGLTSTALPDGTWVVLCRATQSVPSDIGTDENGRQEWSQNFTLEVRSVTTHRE